ncbi:MAG: dicarboxylate/amino acid:cation symporter [Sphingomonas sp.]|uniref:dicarboxylate/amino acid:cation symporter n=1 Tax=Sphingomonas sp. TaxID=28214 RepID=UPI0025FA446D|nr:dicarboxylate/amino acid:cation symporter [Sphingomonas sp.]MBX3564435.1 dicarboxylate/amino acid:cation symporter [Sphingomonas sp.]
MGAVATEYAAVPPAPLPFWKHLYFWVLVGIAAGVMLGALAPAWGAWCEWIGLAFVDLVKMVIAPVIFLTVVTGIAGSRELRSTGRVAIKALGYFLFFSTLALIVGLLVAHFIQPGAGMHVDAATLDASKVHGYEEKAHETTVIGFIRAMIPATLFSAFTSGSILQVLLVAILFGVSLALVGEPARPVTEMLERIGAVVFRLVRIVMAAAPVGAFGAMAFTVGKYGVGALASLAWLVGSFYVTALIFVLVVLGGTATLAGFSIFKLLRYLKAELLLVLGTSSSEAALPALIDRMEHAGIDRQVVGLVVPLGYSFNLDGTNIYMTLAALFIAQATGVELSLGQQIALLGVAMLSSKGAAGVTGSGFITLAATLAVVPSVPVAGMALILGVDRFMSECRSLTNFIGNAVATVVVGRWEGAVDRERLAAALDGRLPEMPTRPAAEADPD